MLLHKLTPLKPTFSLPPAWESNAYANWQYQVHPHHHHQQGAIGALEGKVRSWRERVLSFHCMSDTLLITCASPSRNRPQPLAYPTSGYLWQLSDDRTWEGIWQKRVEKPVFLESEGRESLRSEKSLMWPIPQASIHFGVRMRVASHVHSHRTLCCTGRMSILVWVR